MFLSVFRLYRPITEKRNSKGRAEVVIETPKYLYIFEFKLNGSAADALEQIERMGYAVPYTDDPRPLFRIGINFSSSTRTIAEWRQLKT